ncbi:MAG: 3-phosphoshikimate 1-carboxyvinyltransferase [Ruminococcaceae bacterium]|nr:3-phosphoshikimate 1-carboxyvinyltransferase [Oscillospiraceae bacterium]
MTVTLNHPHYADRISAPTSKSAAHRALIAAAFADDVTRLTVRTSCEDIDATVRCLCALGADIKKEDGILLVTPIPKNGVRKGAILDCGESGSTLRFLVPVCGAIGADAVFLRAGRLPERPLKPLLDTLEAHGMRFCEDGPRLLSEGSLTAGDYRITANISSQYITGLLFALSLLDEPSRLIPVGRMESSPYIDMTVDTLSRFGATPGRKGEDFLIEGKKRLPLKTPSRLTPEGDYSGAAFLLAMGAIGSHAVTVTELSPSSLQGDAAILSLLTQFGARVSAQGDSVTVYPAPLHAIDIDATEIPDLVPILAVIAAAARGTTHITGAARLRLKESDRLAATSAFLRTIGGDIVENEDGLTVTGGRPLTGGTVDVCGDHRIAMSAAVASLLATDAVVIPHAECTKKSYPSFFEDAFGR